MSALKRTDAARMLEALSDGRRWSTSELYDLNLTPHSRKSNLVHDYGYAIDVTRERSAVAGEKDVYWYRLVGVPAEPTALEQVVEPAAAARLDALRREQRIPERLARVPASIVSVDAETPSAASAQAEDAGRVGATPFPVAPTSVGGDSFRTPRPVAAATPSGEEQMSLLGTGALLREIGAAA